MNTLERRKILQKKLPEEKAEKWTMERGEEVMKKILECKMASSKPFCNSPMATEDNIIAEATPDKKWACGLPPFLATTTKQEYYPGENKLGKLMMQIRDEEMKSQYV